MPASASCEFDIETAHPTYKLIIGTPASQTHLLSCGGWDCRRTSSTAQIRDKLSRAEIEQAKTVSIIESTKASADFVLSQLDRACRAKGSERPEDDGYVLPRPLKKGDQVYLRSIGTIATVLSLPDKSGSLTVQAGAARTKTNISNLKLVDEHETIVVDREKRRVPASEYKPEAAVKPVKKRDRPARHDRRGGLAGSFCARISGWRPIGQGATAWATTAAALRCWS